MYDYDYKLGRLLEAAFPFAIAVFMIILVVIYRGLRRLFGVKDSLDKDDAGFYDVADRLINYAVLANDNDDEDEFVAALDTVMTIATLTPASKFKTTTYLLKGSADETIGKYFGGRYTT